MTDVRNKGAITIRRPGARASEEDQERFDQLRGFADAEMRANGKGEGPTTHTELWMAMAADRYAGELDHRKRDDARIQEESRERAVTPPRGVAEPEAATAEDLF